MRQKGRSIGRMLLLYARTRVFKQSCHEQVRGQSVEVAYQLLVELEPLGNGDHPPFGSPGHRPCVVQLGRLRGPPWQHEAVEGRKERRHPADFRFNPSSSFFIHRAMFSSRFKVDDRADQKQVVLDPGDAGKHVLILEDGCYNPQLGIQLI